MGLDFSHGDASWAYSGFNRFRNKLAEEIQMNLNKMEGFTEPNSMGLCLGESWDSWDSDPITLLLNHSDCDGELTPKECKVIAPRLRHLVSSWSDADFDKQRALRLAEGLEEAATANETFEFC